MSVERNDRIFVGIVWGIVIIGLWEVVAFLLQNVFQDPMAATKLPYLHVIIATFIQNAGALLGAGLVTFSRAAAGFLVGGIIGIILAVIMSLSKTVERIGLPYLIISQMIPILALAPIIFNIVKDMDSARIIIAAYITFFPVAINMLSGLKAVERDQKDLLYSVAASQVEIYYKLMFPFSMPYLFTGLKIAAPLAITASILVDMLGSSSGIGVKILYALYSNSSNIFWAAVLTSALMGISGYYLVVLGEKVLLPWNKTSSKKGGDNV